jgi:signal peptidase I
MTDDNLLRKVDTHLLADVLREHIREDRIARLTVSSDSMSPLLKSGDIIGLRHASEAQIQPGKIVTFNAPGDPQGLKTHRIVASWRNDQGNRLILTRGDHVLTFDPPWNAEAVVGQVIWRARNGRILKFDQGLGQWLSRQLGLIAEMERAQISGLPIANLVLTPDSISYANRRAQLARIHILSRITSLASRSARGFLALFTQLFAEQGDFNAPRARI